MNFYLVTTTGHGLFGAHYYAFSLPEVYLVLGCIIGTTVGFTLLFSGRGR